MPNNPTVATVITLTSGSTGVVDMYTMAIPRCNLRLECEYNNTTITGETLISISGGFGGQYDPAVTYPWNQAIPLAVATNGVHPCTTVAWGLDTTSIPLSTLNVGASTCGQTATINFSRVTAVPPWNSLNVFNNTNRTMTFRVFVENN